MQSSFYSENPMPDLYVRNRDKDYLKKTFLNGVDFEHNDEVGFNESTIVYPEDELDVCIERIRITCDNLTKKYEKSEKRVLHLVSTHAAIVKCFSAVYGGELSQEWCYFCAFSGIEINGKDWKLIFHEDSSHVKARL